MTSGKELCLFVSLVILLEVGDCVRTKNKIYKELNTQNACFRSLNATHQIGCTSSSDGNVGVLHYLESKDDFDWVLKDGPNPPYVVLMNSVQFNNKNVDQLVASKRVNGILVINLVGNETLSPVPSQFSADRSCPNDAYGLYQNSNEYKNCQKQTWNTAGSDNGLFFKDYGIPMFSLPNVTDVEKLINDCYEKFNRPLNDIARSYPLCAVQLTDHMDAAKDSITCIRRSNRITNLNTPVRFCDPLGDKNIVATMKVVQTTETRPNNSVVIISAKMDTMSMFYNEYPSADATVTGVVTLLAIVEALGKVAKDIQNTTDSKDIMFAFFQGESFDYIGSSRMVYDMESPDKLFPQEVSDGKLGIQAINLQSIHSFVELSQVGIPENGKFWIHTDPITRKQLKNPNQLSDMIKSLKTLGTSLNVSLEEVAKDAPLPPSSIQRFLMKTPTPALVIADHQKEFTNKYYNSRFDLPANINVTNHTNSSQIDVDPTTESITNLATTLSQFLYELSTGKKAPDDLSANISTVETLLQCFLYNPHCELFRQSVEPEDANSLEKAKKPFPFYVSVASQTNQVTSLTRSIVAQYLGEKLPQYTKETCKQPDEDQTYQYLWIQGMNVQGSRDGACIKSTAMFTKAKSPAFDIEDYDWTSGLYSTWTESVWDPLQVRIFLVPSQQFQTTTLSVGVIIMLVSFVLVYFINEQSDILFSHPTSNRYYTY